MWAKVKYPLIAVTVVLLVFLTAAAVYVDSLLKKQQQENDFKRQELQKQAFKDRKDLSPIPHAPL